MENFPWVNGFSIRKSVFCVVLNACANSHLYFSFVDPSKRGQFFHIGICLCVTKKRNLQLQFSRD